MKRRGYCGKLRIFDRKTRDPILPDHIIHEPPEWEFNRDFQPCVLKFKFEGITIMQRLTPDTAVVVERHDG